MSDTLPGLDTDPLTDIAAMLRRIGCRSYALHVTDTTYYSARNPDATNGAKRVGMHLTIVGRTYYEAVINALGNPKVTERVMTTGTRAWSANADTDDRKLLVEGVSFQHHDDWEARE